MRSINELEGKTLTKINKTKDELIFYCDNGDIYKMYHSQDCCEDVTIDDITGDLSDLINSPILKANEVTNKQFETEYNDTFIDKGDCWGFQDKDNEYKPESHTWTFYKFVTKKGYVDIRWFGESNGYYSESVDFIKVGEDSEY